MIPFEKNNQNSVNYTSIGYFINPIDQEQFSKLKKLVNSYDDSGVSLWFSNYENKLTKKNRVLFKSNLAMAIGKTSYFFSSSNYNIHSKKELDELMDLQYLILLKHFNLDEQLFILTQEFDLESLKVFELLYQSAYKEKKENTLYNSRILLDPLFKFFIQEKFEKCIEIENIIHRNINLLENNIMVFSHQGATSYYSKLNNTYSLTDEIILNYSDNKNNFLLSRNIPLPKKDIAIQLLKDIEHNYNDRTWTSNADKETLELINTSIEKYFKALMFFDLNDNLITSCKNINNNKI